MLRTAGWPHLPRTSAVGWLRFDSQCRASPTAGASAIRFVSMTIAQAFEIAVRHHQAGRLAEAEGLYRQILSVAPRHADTLHLLGVIAHQAGRNDLAGEMIRQAIFLNPDNPEFHSNLGVALSEHGHVADAIAAYHRALQLQPDFAKAHNNLGLALSLHGRFTDAIAAYRRALQINPDQAEVLNNLGLALGEDGQLDEAVATYRQALRINQSLGEIQNNLGTALKDQGQLDEAMECYQRAIALKPQDAVLHSNLVYSARFHPAYDARRLREEDARWEQRHGAPLERFILPHKNNPDPERRLKVGYVSPDFWHHVVCHFLTPLLEAHDHAGFDIHCYASVKRPDPITERLRKTADAWRNVLGVRDEELAGRIREDGIDILVDLTQHLTDSRLLVFARKPAPLQVAWLGYPGSTGLRAMDCRLTDSHMEPEGSAWSESVEKPVRLPDSWFCFDPIDDFPSPSPLPALRTGQVTFGCLNNFCKVNEAVLHRWTGVMRAVAGSKLLLRCPGGGSGERVHQFFASRGIEAHRVELVGRTSTRAEFLELFARIDIALDPFPYNGGTTTCETLWMGVPVLTLPGEEVVSRIGLSILSAAGLREFVAFSEAEYVTLAGRLAGDLAHLAHLRATLRARMQASAFMDAPRFARHVEQAYRQMWRNWCARQCSTPPS